MGGMYTTLMKIPYLRLKYKFFPDNAQRFWAQELLNSQGLTAKLGQVLGQGKETELPKSSLSIAEARVLFGKKFKHKIEFSSEIFAASMGQVFFISLEGHRYALKILHPGIKDKLKKEISNILLLGGYFAKAKGFSFDKEVFKRFLVNIFEEETDLVREAQFQDKFFRIFEDDKRFKVPKVIKEFSNENFLCQERVDSTLARELKSFPHHHIFSFFFHSLFDHGVLHGDLNDRNWGLIGNDAVAVYDYGCTQIISERRISGLKKLIMNKDVVQGLIEMGVRLEATWFKGREQELRDALFCPLFETTIPAKWSYSEELTARFGDKIKILREYTDPWVLLMMRSLFSLIKIYQDRGVSISLGEIVAPYLSIKEKSMKAEQIRIEVLEGEKQVVYMTLPITALDNMEDLMPEKVLSKIRSEGLSLKTMINRAKETNLVPQDLFGLNIDNRSYKVWID